MEEVGVLEAAAEGLEELVSDHEFGDIKDLKMTPEQATGDLRSAAMGADVRRYAADMWAALVSDAVIVKGKTKPTPLCFLGAGRTSFLKNFVSVPRLRVPPKRGSGGARVEISETDCLREALFSSWRRLDATLSFRWDPNEDSRHALRWTAPTDQKETTQHGANRLASIGLSALTVVPCLRYGSVQLEVLGGERGAGGHFGFNWPIWREPTGLAGIRAFLGHPYLDRSDTCEALGIVERRRARRVSNGRYPSITRGQPEFGQ